MSERPLDLGDIQGNVLGGFNTDYQVLVGLMLNDGGDPAKAVAWLASLSEAITSADQVRRERDAMKNAPHSLAPWLSVAIGYRIMATQRDVYIRDSAFRLGMIKRASSVLGDATDERLWAAGSSGKPLDVLFIVASNDETAAVALAQSIVTTSASADLSLSYQETGKRIDGREHFGFKDGISQPEIAGFDAADGLAAGNFVFGYPEYAGGDPVLAGPDPRNVTDNGSLLVFRRLQQDVKLFGDFCEREAARIAPQWPGMSAPLLAALIVGRWPSGAPISAGQLTDPGVAQEPDNTFDFHDDDDASKLACPFGAHIRKVNPRNSVHKDVTPPPRVLRRGIPFGQPIDGTSVEGSRGLLFVAYQASIPRQFEFLTLHWMNSGQNPAPGHDLLVGRSNSARQMTVLGPQGPVTVEAPAEYWITPTGGGYLFCPGRAGLRKMKELQSPIGVWQAERLWASTADKLKDLFE